MAWQQRISPTGHVYQVEVKGGRATGVITLILGLIVLGLVGWWVCELTLTPSHYTCPNPDTVTTVHTEKGPSTSC